MKQETVYFEVADLLGVGMTLVVLGIGVAYGLNVISDVEEDFCPTGVAADGLCNNATGGTGGVRVNGYEINSTLDTKAAVAKIPQKLGLIVTVVLASIIIGILVRYLFVKFS